MPHYTTKQCPVCGKEYKITYKNPKQKTCGSICNKQYRAAGFQAKRPPVICIVCGKEFRPKPSAGYRMCSHDCAYRLRSTPPPVSYQSDTDTYHIPLTRGYIAIIDAIDSDLTEYRWSAGLNGRDGAKAYAKRNHLVGETQRNVLHMHRVIVSRILGRALEKTDICDHVNGNTLDNRRCNLRIATASQNIMNRPPRSGTASGLKGVSFDKRYGTWRASIKANGKTRHLGSFRDPHEAHAAYMAVARELHGEFTYDEKKWAEAGSLEPSITQRDCGDTNDNMRKADTP